MHGQQAFLVWDDTISISLPLHQTDYNRALRLEITNVYYQWILGTRAANESEYTSDKINLKWHEKVRQSRGAIDRICRRLKAGCGRRGKATTCPCETDLTNHQPTKDSAYGENTSDIPRSWCCSWNKQDLGQASASWTRDALENINAQVVNDGNEDKPI